MFPQLSFPQQITVIDVSPRDGLQSEPVLVPTEKKVQLIRALIEAGIPKIEVTSFVSPKWVPQLADAVEVLQAIPHDGKTQYQVLIPNEKGYDRARATGLVKEVGFVVAATESLNRRNVNMSVEDSMQQFAVIVERAKADGMRVRGAIGVAFVCPHEGKVPVEQTVKLADEYLRLGADEVAISDTLGAAAPNHVYEVFARVKDKWPDATLAGHFHDTQAMALANIVAAMQGGATAFDASIGELGGCQFTKGATGNVATERVVNMLHAMGIDTGVDLAKLKTLAVTARTMVTPEA
jgi:hydroxymethylglutaryl-CoA lyase